MSIILNKEKIEYKTKISIKIALFSPCTRSEATNQWLGSYNAMTTSDCRPADLQ